MSSHTLTRKAGVAIVLLGVFVFGLATLLLEPPASLAREATTSSDQETVTLLVKFKPATTRASAEAVVKANGGSAVRDFQQTRTRSIRVPARAAERILANLRGHSSVEQAAAAVSFSKSDLGPNDPDLAQQWALAKMNWQSAYSAIGISGSATLAVLDTGVAGGHAEFAGKTITAVSFTGGDALGDANGHGTALAGIATAGVNDATGMAGVAYAGVEEILALQVLDASGTGTDADIVAGVLWAADNGASVILMGFASPDHSFALADAIAYAWSKGALVVAATGNDGSSAYSYPAGMPYAIGVSATDQDDSVASFSNTGSAAVSAPGVQIWTTAPDGGYTSTSGTSAAAAHAAGLAALLMASGATNAEASSMLRAGAVSGRIDVAASFTADRTLAPTAGTPAGGAVDPTYQAAAKNLTITFIGGGAGQVGLSGVTGSPAPSSSPCDSTAGSTCTNSLNNNASGTLTATASTGSVFTGWSDATNTSHTASAGGFTCTGNVCRFFMGTGGGNAQSIKVSFETAGVAISPSAASVTSGSTQTFSGSGGASACAPLPANAVSWWRAEGNGYDTVGANTGTLVSTAGYATGQFGQALSLNGGYMNVPNHASLSPTRITLAAWVRAPSFPGTGNPRSIIKTGLSASGAYTLETSNTGALIFGVADGAWTVTPAYGLSAGTWYHVAGTYDGSTLRLYVNGVEVSSAADSGSIGSTTTAILVGSDPSNTANRWNGLIDEAMIFDRALTAAEVKGLACQSSFSLQTNSSGATINSTTGLYTAGPNRGVTDTVRFTRGAAFADATVTVTNNPPVASNDNYLVNEDTTLNASAPGVLGNDSDADGDVLTAALVSGPSKGTLTLNANGSFTYTPNANYNGPDSFTYRASDGTAQSAVATVAINVNPVNDAPVAANDSYATNEDTTLNVSAPGVLGNDSDADGNSLTAVLVTSTANGTLTLNANGSFTYTPNANYNGPDSFSYRGSDGTAQSANATVSITVNPVNDAPIAVNDSYATNEDTTLNVSVSGVLGNDSDADGNALTAALMSGPSKGALTLNANGSFTYTPNANVSGSDSFTYRASDGTAQSAVATVTINVAAVNDKPAAIGLAVSANEDTVKGINLDGSDVETAGSDLVVTITTTPANGSLRKGSVLLTVGSTTASGAITYIPNANYNGPDSFTFKVTDTGDGSSVALDSEPATVSITVAPVNDAPSFTKGADHTVLEDAGAQSVSNWATNISAGPADEAGQTLTFSVTNDNNALFSVQPALAADGTLSYTPAANANGSATVTLTLSDNGGTASGGADTSAPQTFKITVTPVNDAPSFTKGADHTVPEGAGAQSVTAWATAISGGPANEAGQSFTFFVTSDNSALFSAQPAVAPNGTLTYTPVNASGTATVTVTLKDDGGTANGGVDTSASQTFAITITNVAPTVTPAAGQTASEGSSTSFSLGSFSDPGTSDNPWKLEVNWGDATTAYTADLASQGTLPAPSHTYADNGSYTVTVKVTDKDGGSDTKTFTITVSNVAPSVSAGGSATVDEGSLFTRAGSFVDPGADTWTAKVNYGDGSGDQVLALNPDKTFTLSHTYADNGSYTVTVTVTDDDAGSGSASFTVAVNNVAPTATLGNSGPVNEASPAAVSFTGQSDPSSADTTAGFRYAFSCSNGDLSGATYAASAASASTSCAFDDNGSYTVKGRILDKDGGYTEHTTLVTVNNVAPTATLGDTGPVDEGSSFTLQLTSPLDPSSADTTAGFQYAFDCGTGYGTLGSANSTTCPTSDNGTRAVKGKIQDKDGGVTEYTASVTVNNVAPTIISVSGPIDPIAKGTSATVGVTFTDPGTLDTHSCTFSWDGAGIDTTAAASGGGCSATQTFGSAGVYTITVTVTDDDGGTASSKFEYVVVYDPNGGFVTGGGWISSPIGAYAANPSLTGKANFGFVSKYQKGANKPTGNTEFQFKAGNLNFHSSNYEWLVVAGAKAQFKGTGTINGSGSYGFLLTATDGQTSGGNGVDKFRIKIWDTLSGVVVYDNATGTSDDIDSASPQALGGGSIVIHSQK